MQLPRRPASALHTANTYAAEAIIACNKLVVLPQTDKVLQQVEELGIVLFQRRCLADFKEISVQHRHNFVSKFKQKIVS